MYLIIYCGNAFEYRHKHARELLTVAGALRVLKIRNPWGKKEWQGALSANSGRVRVSVRVLCLPVQL